MSTWTWVITMFAVLTSMYGLARLFLDARELFYSSRSSRTQTVQKTFKTKQIQGPVTYKRNNSKKNMGNTKIVTIRSRVTGWVRCTTCPTSASSTPPGPTPRRQARLLSWSTTRMRCKMSYINIGTPLPVWSHDLRHLPSFQSTRWKQCPPSSSSSIM